MKLTKDQYKTYVRHMIDGRMKRYGAEYACGLTLVDYGLAEGIYELNGDKWQTCIETGFYIGE